MGRCGVEGVSGCRAYPSSSRMSCFVFLQVNVKRPMKDETHFEVVESGRYIILLLGKALSVVWDRHLSISVVLKQTYQVSGFSCFILLGTWPLEHFLLPD